MPRKWKLECPCDPVIVDHFTSQPTIGYSPDPAKKEARDIAIERATDEAWDWATKRMKDKLLQCPSKYPNCCDTWHKVVVEKVQNVVPYKKGDYTAVVKVEFALLVKCYRIKCPEPA